MREIGIDISAQQSKAITEFHGQHFDFILTVCDKAREECPAFAGETSFAGVAPFDDLKPVKKFTSRKLAVARIWSAVQRLAADAQQPARDVAPAAKRSTKSPAKAPRRARAQKGAKEERPNKKAEVVTLMKRAKGATLAEIMETTGWQKHTVRGFVSILGSKGGLTIESAKTSAGERTYRVAR